QGDETTGGGGSHCRRNRGKPRVLRRQVFPATPLPARRPHGFLALGLEASFCEASCKLVAVLLFSIIFQGERNGNQSFEQSCSQCVPRAAPRWCGRYLLQDRRC